MAAAIESWLGLGIRPENLSFLQMCLRGAVVFFFGVILVRVGDRRMLGRNSGFDMFLVVILGSVLSRGVNGQAAFGATLGASAFIVGLHYIVSAAAWRWPAISRLVKGSAIPLLRHGQADAAALRRHHITPDDLDENLRMNGNISTRGTVEEARLERNGAISVTLKDPS